jgi:hypothetical protein
MPSKQLFSSGRPSNNQSCIKRRNEGNQIQEIASMTPRSEDKGRAIAELVLREDRLGVAARVLQEALAIVTDALAGQPEEDADADDEQQDHDDGAA